MIEDDDDDMETSRMDTLQGQWLPPVGTVDELPRRAPDGARCFVHGSDTIWRFEAGKWNELGRSSGPRG